MSTTMKIFGQRVALLRKEMGLTQKELAQIIHISTQALYRIEKGMNRAIPTDIVRGLTMKLQCTEDYLSGFSESPSKTRNYKDIPIIRYPAWMEEFKKESAELFMQDSQLARLLFQCSNHLSPDDLKKLKEIIGVFLKNAK